MSMRCTLVAELSWEIVKKPLALDSISKLQVRVFEPYMCTQPIGRRYMMYSLREIPSRRFTTSSSYLKLGLSKSPREYNTSLGWSLAVKLIENTLAHLPNKGMGIIPFTIFGTCTCNSRFLSLHFAEDESAILQRVETVNGYKALF